MLRILVIAPTMFFSDRGCHVRILEQVRALRKRGHRPVVLTYHSGRDIGSIPLLRIRRTPWYDKLVAGPSLHFIYMDTMLLVKCLRHARREPVDVIHAHLHEGAFIAQNIVMTRFLRGTPYLFDAQGSLTGEMTAHGFVGKSTPLHHFWRWLEADIDRRAPQIITSSGHLAEMMMGDFGVSSHKVRAIPDGVDIERFRPGDSYTDRDRLRRLRHKLGIPPGREIVGYLGGMDSHKGIDHLLEAIPEVLEVNGNVHFLLMGYPGEDVVRDIVRERGVSDNVTVTGKISYFDAPAHLALADIAVAPKLLRWGEGNGKLFNYMGCGLPVIAFDHATNREVLGDAGVFAEMDDPRSLARSIIGLLGDKEGRVRRGRALREIAVENYSWDICAERIEERYRKLLAGGH